MSIEETAVTAEKKDKPWTAKRIKRRIEMIEAMTDPKRASKARQRLSVNVLTAIAEGTVRDPRKTAALVVALPERAPAAEVEM